MVNRYVALTLLLVIVIAGLLVFEVYMDKWGQDDAVAQHAAKLNQQIVKVRQDIDVINTALEQYRHDHLTLPTTEQGLSVLVKSAVGVPAKDPNYSIGYLVSVPKDAWGRDYIYQYPGDFSEYDVYSYGENGIEDDDDIGNWLRNKGAHGRTLSKHSLLGAPPK